MYIVPRSLLAMMMKSGKAATSSEWGSQRGRRRACFHLTSAARTSCVRCDGSASSSDPHRAALSLWGTARALHLHRRVRRGWSRWLGGAGGWSHEWAGPKAQNQVTSRRADTALSLPSFIVRAGERRNALQVTQRRPRGTHTCTHAQTRSRPAAGT